MRPVRLALAQVAMHWEGDDNTQAVVDAIAQVASAGCRLALFSELAVTGYHRRIKEMAVPARVAGWMQRVQAACATHGVAAGVGLPTFGDGGAVHNSYAFVDEAGQRVGLVHKRGLTAAEATFMQPGHARPVVALAGLRLTAMLCREVEDEAEVLADLAGQRPQLVVWPGLIGPEPRLQHHEPPLHVQQAQRIARKSGAWIVQVNWPNAVNDPRENVRAGRSVVIAPDGSLRLALPRSQAGIAVFTLGASTHAWHAQPAAA